MPNKKKANPLNKTARELQFEYTKKRTVTEMLYPESLNEAILQQLAHTKYGWLEEIWNDVAVAISRRKRNG